MKIYDTLNVYDELPHVPIQYGVCRDFNHLSRYRGLRQLVHDPSDEENRFVALENPNPFTTDSDVTYYEVPLVHENRLDLIAEKLLGSSQYRWVIAYFNSISDGYTVKEGQIIRCPKSISSLFNQGEVLAPINPLQLNLGTE